MRSCITLITMYRLVAIVPKGKQIDWPLIERTVMAPYVEDMRSTPQTQRWHGEGDVWTHTRMVCEELMKLDGFQGLPERQRQEVFLSTLFHDIGKPAVTKFEDGHYSTRGHARRGEQMVRSMLWKEYGLSGSAEARQFRETVCSLIRHHGLPLYIAQSPHEEPHFRAIAAEAELSGDYTWELQCLVTEADVRGRIADDVPELLSDMEYCRLRAQELGCYTGPYSFPDAHTRYRYLDGHPISPDYSFFNETWGEVVVVCGLPGTGKDTFIERNYPGLPVVSLDDIRNDLDILPTENQGRVVQKAIEQARGFLRAHQPFVWNATNLTRMTRARILGLCADYKAAARIVFLETPWEENLRRNASRTAMVPPAVIERMLEKLEMPYPLEADDVDWKCI